jgi:hypothetical protein
MLSVAIVDRGAGVQLGEIAIVAAAIGEQVNRHFAPCMGVLGPLTWIRAGTWADVQPWEWVLTLDGCEDSLGDLGYHQVTAAGTPVMRIFPGVSAMGGVPWSVDASHEILETLVDPLLTRVAFSPNGVCWTYEVCDPVAADMYGIGLVPVSNFVLPSYFEPLRYSGPPFDFMGLLSAPFQIRTGGYNQYLGPGGWAELRCAPTAPGRASAAHRGRRVRRRVATRQSARGC